MESDTITIGVCPFGAGLCARSSGSVCGRGFDNLLECSAHYGRCGKPRVPSGAIRRVLSRFRRRHRGCHRG